MMEDTDPVISLTRIEISDGRGAVDTVVCNGVEETDLTGASPRVLSRLNEFKIIQNILQDIKGVLTFSEDVLRGQEKYWIRFTSCAVDELEQRERITKALERHCHTPVRWIVANEIEININPDDRIFHSE